MEFFRTAWIVLSLLFIYDILCFQAPKWKPLDRFFAWRNWLSSKSGQNTNWPEQHIWTNTQIICELKQNKAFVSVFLIGSQPISTFVLVSSTIPFLHIHCSFVSLPLWIVTWTTIQLVDKFHLNSPDYRILFTCKFLTNYCLKF